MYISAHECGYIGIQCIYNDASLKVFFRRKSDAAMKAFTVNKMVHTNSDAGTVIPRRACVTLYHTHIISELLGSTRVCTKKAQAILQTLCNKPQIGSILKSQYWTFHPFIFCFGNRANTICMLYTN